MLVKTFQAGSMGEALQMVKAEFGTDAMIISSKKERRKGILSYFSKPVFAVTATIDPSPRPVRNPYQEDREAEGSTLDLFKKSMLEPLVREIRDLKGKVDALTVKEDTHANSKENQQAQGVGEESVKGGYGRFFPEDMAKPEIQKITDHLLDAAVARYRKKTGSAVQQLDKELVAEVSAVQSAVSRQSSPWMQEILHELRAAGLEEKLCGTLVDSLQQSPGADGKDTLKNNVKESIAAMIRCSGQLRLKKEGPKLIVLVGPTGVGKTTTIAKLAAMYTLKKKSKVALVTTDGFRAGAVEQLKTYAKVLRLPLEVVATRNELETALCKHADKDLILIDTTGKSPSEQEKLDELKSLLEGLDTECHLCVSAMTRDSELENILDQFVSALPVHRLLFTKLDESRQLGCMVNLHIRNKLPLSYFTKGQRVPEDIEIATGKKIAELVMGG